MVTVEIIGGLGNQMFQYAAAKALAESHKAEVQIDLRSFRTDDLRNFDLDFFALKRLIAPQSTRDKNNYSMLARLYNQALPYKKRFFYKEPYFHFNPNFFKLQPPIYIKGYFQSEKYFKQIEGTIRKEFVFQDDTITRVRQFALELNNEKSVAVHIRRGDYHNTLASNYHGILPRDYYLKAISTIRQFIEQPRFYIFSDQPVDALSLGLSDATVVSGDISKTHFEDMFLMSQCRHNIIANSSFSWWAAWLNQNPEKIVVAPSKWFNNGPKDTYDILPETWITI